MGIFMAGMKTEFSCKPKTRNYSTSAIAVLGLLVVAGCNSETIVTPESQLTISPDQSSYDIVEFRDASGNCLFSPEFYQDVPVNLVLTDSLNRSLGGAPVTVYVDFTGNTFSGRESLSLYSDMNGNGVIDNIDELVSGVGDEAFTARTDTLTGTVRLLLRVNLSCAYRGSLYAFSGPVAAVSSISVNDISELSDIQDDPTTMDLLTESFVTEGPVTVDPASEEF